MQSPNSPLACSHCGTTNVEGSRFCRSCGTALSTEEATTRILETPTEIISPIDQTTSALNSDLATTPIGSLISTSSGPISATSILSAMPVLQYLARKKSSELGEAFANYHFIFILHFLADLLGFIEAFRILGMQWQNAHFLHKPYLYPYKDRIAKQLANEGADVINLTPNSLHTIVGNIIAQSKSDNQRIIVVEDGGYIVPLLHSRFSMDLDRFVGAVEQTTKGLNADRAVMPLKFPVLSVANARIKLEKESPEIATAVWDNIRKLLFRTNRDLRTPKILIVGYGTIGTHLATHLRRNGATVKIFDSDPDKRSKAKDDGYVVGDTVVELIKGEHGLIIIGATGTTSIGPQEILAMDHGTILVSASSDQREIGVQELKYLSTDQNGTPLSDPVTGEIIGHIYRIGQTDNEITLLAEGYPINFWNTESMPLRVSQVAMVPLFLSAVTLVARTDLPVGEPDADSVDRIIDDEGIYLQL